MEAGRPVHLDAALPLAETAGALLGEDVAIAGGPVCDWIGSLLDGEEEAVARAVTKRRQEFVAGRVAARHAMAWLGQEPVALPRRPAGPPAWPEGITGSITHGAGYVLAAVGRRGPGLRALGIDLEAHVPMSDGLLDEICRPDEDRSRGIEVFGAKEAAYKAQFMLSEAFLDHAALRIRFDGPGRFLAEFTVEAGPFRPGDRLHGRQAWIGPLLLSTVRIGAPDVRLPGPWRASP